MAAKWSQWQVIYSSAWTNEFNNLVRKRIPYSAEIAEETMEEVRQELAIKLSNLDEAPNSLNAYLRTAFRNTLEDYLRKKEGYPRPPEWIKRLGAAYERIYKLLCLERRAVNDIHAIMDSLYQHTRDFVEQVISEVRAGVVNCGSWRESVSMDNALTEVEAVGVQDPMTQTPDAVLQNMDTHALIETILGGANDSMVGTAGMEKVLASLRQCQINDDERLLLRLVYTDGHSVSQAARIRNLPDAEARRLLKNTLQRLKQALLDAGISL